MLRLRLGYISESSQEEMTLVINKLIVIRLCNYDTEQVFVSDTRGLFQFSRSWLYVLQYSLTSNEILYGGPYAGKRHKQERTIRFIRESIDI